MQPTKTPVLRATIIAGIAVVLVLVAGTLWMGGSAASDTERAVRSVSLLYLDELAGRREQVIEANLAANTRKLNVAISLMDDGDLSDLDHLRAYEARMKELLDLELFAFVDTQGLIYTTTGTQDNIGDFAFDHLRLEGSQTSVLDLGNGERKVVIATPVDLKVGDTNLVACFMQIDMATMLEGVSMQSSQNDATFCNLYTHEGVPLTNVVLGGLAEEDNLLDALSHATLEEGYDIGSLTQDFANGRAGVVSFTYGGIAQTMSYVPVAGTDWMLTYLIRESVISNEISSVTDGIVARSLLQSALVAGVLFAMFATLIAQTRKNDRLMLERETADAAMRVKQAELEQRLELQERLLEQERKHMQQDRMITALASDYRSVYYVDLDTDDAICYRTDSHLAEGVEEGSHFSFHDAFTDYANTHVAPAWRDDFLRFIDPASIRSRLSETPLIAHRYLAVNDEGESFEMLRMAGVRHIEDREDGIVHAVGVGFSDIDAEMRESMARNQALSDALSAAEEASKAKTTFLSNMSHEIRTPMNAIIGLDDIALASDALDGQTRDHLTKIGESARHLLALINDILDVSRIESGRMTLKNEEFSFSQLIEQVNTIFTGQCAERGLVYTCEVAPDVEAYYIGDNMKLRQVLINILGNAVKFTPEGGSVSLTTRRVAGFDGKTTLEFKVKDSGIGMSEEFLPHIFDTFAQEDASTTNRAGSSGLGMAITKSIVEMMNGNISVESEKGKGSTFTFTVTLLDAARVAGDSAQDMQVEPHELSVLVVDDDPISCEHARLVLGQIGIACETSQSGSEAIEMVRLRHARHDPYNLILIDWKMPEMDGIECARRIRRTCGCASAIIILTAYRFDDVVDEARDAGVDSFLSKPLFASSVIEEFHNAIRNREGTQADASEAAELSGRHILLAEDVDLNAEIMEMILQMREITVERVTNGIEACEAFARSEAGHFDCILMDIRMPEMDGLDATEHIRAMDRPDAHTIPIIALTANAFDEDVQRSLQAGMNAHLSKPIEPERLFETLESLL